MSSANVSSLQALLDLKIALTQFSSDAQESLQSASQQLQQAMDGLDERQRHWQNKVRQSQQQTRQLELQTRQLENQVQQQTRAVEVAQDALADCRASAYRDEEGYYHQPDCSGYAAQLGRASRQLSESQRNLDQTKQQLAEAQRALAEATATLAEVVQWNQRTHQAAAEYQRVAQRLAAEMGSNLLKASALLGRASTDIEHYLEMGAAVGATPDAGLLERMGNGVVDLSRKTEWGKFAHNAYEEVLEEAYGDLARSEVTVKVRLPDGTEKEGRIDSLLENLVIDYKTHDLERLEQKGRLDYTLGKIKDQVQSYCSSPDTPKDSLGVVMFEFRPKDPALRQHIEEYLAPHNVLWGAE